MTASAAKSNGPDHFTYGVTRKGEAASKRLALQELHKACRDGDGKEVVNCLSKAAVRLDERSPLAGRAAIHEACAHGHFEVAAILAQSGASIDIPTALGRDTPLHLATQSNNRALVFMLLQRGCDPNCQDRYGKTPFHYVSRPAIVKLMLRYGGDVCIKDAGGATPRDRVREACGKDKELNKTMSDAYEQHELARLKAKYAKLKEDEDHMNAIKRAELERRRRDLLKEQALEAGKDYIKWRNGQNSFPAATK